MRRSLDRWYLKRKVNLVSINLLYAGKMQKAGVSCLFAGNSTGLRMEGAEMTCLFAASD
jgi:hypothetical protein